MENQIQLQLHQFFIINYNYVIRPSPVINQTTHCEMLFLIYLVCFLIRTIFTNIMPNLHEMGYSYTIFKTYYIVSDIRCT